MANDINANVPILAPPIPILARGVPKWHPKYTHFGTFIRSIKRLAALPTPPDKKRGARAKTYACATVFAARRRMGLGVQWSFFLRRDSETRCGCRCGAPTTASMASGLLPFTQSFPAAIYISFANSTAVESKTP